MNALETTAAIIIFAMAIFGLCFIIYESGPRDMDSGDIVFFVLMLAILAIVGIEVWL